MEHEPPSIPPDASPEPEPKSMDSVLVGFLSGLPLHLVALGVVMGSSDLGSVLFAFFGVTQLIYLVPLALFCLRVGSKRAAKGVALLAALTFLINAGCWGLVMTSFSH